MGIDQMEAARRNASPLKDLRIIIAA